MPTLKSKLELYDAFSAPMMQIINTAYAGVTAVNSIQAALNQNVNAGMFDAVQMEMQETEYEAQRLQQVLSGMPDVNIAVSTNEAAAPKIPAVSPIQVPMETALEMQNVQQAVNTIQTPPVNFTSNPVPAPAMPVMNPVQVPAAEMPAVPVPDMQVNTAGLDAAAAKMQQVSAAAEKLNQDLQPIKNPEINMAATGFDSVQSEISNTESMAQQLNSTFGAVSSPSISIDTQAIQNAQNEIQQVNVSAEQLAQGFSEIEFPEIEANISGIELQETKIQALTADMQRIVASQQQINAASQGVNVIPQETQGQIQGLNKSIEQMNYALRYLKENPFELSTEAAQAQIEALEKSIQGISNQQIQLQMQLPDVPAVQTPDIPPVVVPVQWETDSLPVFTNTGIERFEQEIQAAQAQIEKLTSKQAQITAAAQRMQILPGAAKQDLQAVALQIDAIRQRITQIQNNQLNIGTDAANNGLEQLRAQLDSAIQLQEQLNNAIETKNINAANAAYLQLSGTISNTQRFIRNNVSAQGEFNSAIQTGVDKAFNLQSMIGKAIGAFGLIGGIRKAVGWIQETTKAFDTQYNSEIQAFTVLGNRLDAGFVSKFEVQTTADTSEAIAEINAIQGKINPVELSVKARTEALNAAFKEIKDKASEIQGKGIYGDEAMIAAGAEFATYFKDVKAVTAMMDTLSNYAMGMSNGAELDTAAMVSYATNLGKIMTGSFDAMTKKGFEFTDAQKAVIQGTATEAQYLEVLGDGWADMTSDMRAAATISGIINESWAGLYENMSNTPRGKIIQLTNAWGDMKEVIGSQLYPYVTLFVDTIKNNWGTVGAVISSITRFLQIMMVVMNGLLSAAMQTGKAIYDNWDFVAPIIYAAAAALLVWAGNLTYAKAVQAADTAASIAAHAAKMLYAGAITILNAILPTATAAQLGLNTAMYACPVVWIVGAIVALVAVFYLAIAAVNRFAGTSISATGVICGAFMVALAFIGNLFVAAANLIIDCMVTIANAVRTVANFVATVFVDPVNAVIQLFVGMANTVLNILSTIAGVIDTVFGSNLSAAVNNWKGAVAEYAAGLQVEAGATVIPEIDASQYKLQRFDYGEAYDTGYNFGKNLNLGKMIGADLPAFSGMPDMVGKIAENSDSIPEVAGNTGGLKDGLEIKDEDLKYLRDLAEQEAINRYTTAEIHIDMTNNNHIEKGMDTSGFVAWMTDAVNEAIDVVTEGVHK